MKRLLLLTGLLSITLLLFTQPPQSFKYQAVIRDAGGNILSDQQVQVQIAILRGSISGSTAYIETFSVNTNSQGLINLNIGEGSIVSGNFESIPWGEDQYYIKLWVNGNEMGTSPLLSVPYALHAKTAENTFSGNYYDLSGTPDFSGWDKNISDDFDGDYSSLTGVPTGLTDFNNDAGFLTSGDLTGWDKDASNDFSGEFVDLQNIPSGLEDGDDNSQLTEQEVETYVTNAAVDLAEGSQVNGKIINNWNDLMNVPEDIADGDDVLSEAEVDEYVSDNGYLTAEEDGSIENELQDLNQVLEKGSDAGGNKITNLGTPENGLDAATKNYVDELMIMVNDLKEQLENAYSTNSGTFTDKRDGNTYKWVRIGDQIWMAENLRYLPEVTHLDNFSTTTPNYFVYDYFGTDVNEAKQTDNYNTYGVIYNTPAASEVCPHGWNLPSYGDWWELASYISYDNGGYDFFTTISETTYWENVGNHLKSIDGWNNNGNGIDSYGFNALPGGYLSYPPTGFYQIGDKIEWTMACDWEGLQYPPFSCSQVTIDNRTNSALYFPENFPPDISTYVRCIKDK